MSMTVCLDACPICDGRHLHEFLRRGDVPVHQNVVYASAPAARAIPRGDLVMRMCGGCGFVFNAAFDPSKPTYDGKYEGTQVHSPWFVAHLTDLARRLDGDGRIHHVVEIGCGDGAFLRALAGNAAISGIGIDPGYKGRASDCDGRLRFERRRFEDGIVSAPAADLAICRHVVEHTPDPLRLLRTVRGLLDKERASRVYLETPCVEWILENQIIWDWFYEHCSLFSADSLRSAAMRAGLEVTVVRHTFGGQYLAIEATPRAEAAAPAPLIVDTSRPLALAHAFGAAFEMKRTAWCARLRGLTARGPVAVWGAGAKGATFVNLVDADARTIECLIDLNPNKQGRFVGGTGHPIVAPEALRARDVRTVILMNPNYRAETESILASQGLTPDVIA
jgi:Methyltransferase domain/C-methyltransferase C-terminal domain